MKRVSKEHINTVVEKYLKSRNYVGQSIPSKSLQHSLSSSLLNLAADGEVSSLGAINCGCVMDGNNFEYEVQFSRLVQFVKDAPDKHKQSLMQILFPIFISIYVDMLVSGIKQAAHRFHQKNKTIFGNLPIYKTSMESISLVVQKCDRDRSLPMNKILHTELGENKFTVAFTPETLSYLLNYLKSGDNMIVLQVFNANLTIEVTEQMMESTTPAECLVSPPMTRTVHDEASLVSLKSAIDRMRRVVPPLPSMRLNSISSGYPSVICGRVTKDHAVFGCSDSSVRLWSRNGKSIAPQCHDVTRDGVQRWPDVSQVHLSQDWLEDVDEREALSGKFEPRPCITMRGHSSEVYDVTSLDSSSYVLSCSADKTIRLWDTEACINRVIYRGHTQTVWGLAAGHQCSYFASASRDRSARLWTSERTFPLRSYVGHTLAVDCVEFHPNNSYLATGSQDRTVRLWSTQDGKCVRLLQGHKSNILCLAFSPNGKQLASSGEDRKVRLWDLASGELIKEMKGHTDTVHCLEFSTDGSLLCSAGLDNVILVWDTRATPNSQSESGKVASGNSDIIASVSSHDCSIISLQSQSEGVMDIIGIT